MSASPAAATVRSTPWVASVAGTAAVLAFVYFPLFRYSFGEWLKQSGRRDQMIVIGKGAHHDHETMVRRVTPEAIHQDVETSLN